jgi:hypothetical protein
VRWDKVLDFNNVQKIIALLAARHMDKISIADYSMLVNAYQLRNEMQALEALLQITSTLVKKDVNDAELYKLIEQSVVIQA